MEMGLGRPGIATLLTEKEKRNWVSYILGKCLTREVELHKGGNLARSFWAMKQTNKKVMRKKAIKDLSSGHNFQVSGISKRV